jgi:hypothetical protein
MKTPTRRAYSAPVTSGEPALGTWDETAQKAEKEEIAMKTLVPFSTMLRLMRLALTVRSVRWRRQYELSVDRLLRTTSDSPGRKNFK